MKVTDKKCKVDWAEFIKEITDEHYPEAEVITLVMNNLGTHTPGAFYEQFEPARQKPKGYWIGLNLFLPQSTVVGWIWMRLNLTCCITND